jgi:hypothetical protein
MTIVLAPIDKRAPGRTLATISDQLERLVTRVADDVARYADAKVGPTGGGFVIYYLTDDSGEPLKTTNAAESGISLDDIQRTAGFARLRRYCEELSLSLRIDEHFYADEPQPTKIYRVVVDGWS